MSGRRIIIILCLALTLSIATVPANGEETSGTVTLYWLEYHAIEMNSRALMDMEASWDIRVTDGAPVNVYFMSSAQYQLFEDPLYDDLEYSELYSMLNTTSFSRSARLMDGQRDYLVIECAGFSSIDSSTVEYEVEWDEAGEDWYEWCIPGFIGIGAVAGVAIFLWWRMRGGRTEGAPPDATPPPGTG
jgi:hypothetical protein